MQLAPFALVAELEGTGTAIIVNHQWEATIWGDSLEHCVAALVKYHQGVVGALGTKVVTNLTTPRPTPELLRDVVARREQQRARQEQQRARRRFVASVIVPATMSIAATIAVAIFLGG